MNGSAWRRFRANRRGWWSLWIFAALYAAALCARFISADASDNPHAIF